MEWFTAFPQIRVERSKWLKPGTAVAVAGPGREFYFLVAEDVREERLSEPALQGWCGRAFEIGREFEATLAMVACVLPS